MPGQSDQIPQLVKFNPSTAGPEYIRFFIFVTTCGATFLNILKIKCDIKSARFENS